MGRNLKYKTSEEARNAKLETMRNWWHKHTLDPEFRKKHRERQKKYRQEHIDEIRAYKREWQREYYKTHPHKSRPKLKVYQPYVSKIDEVRKLQLEFEKQEQERLLEIKKQRERLLNGL